MGDRREYPRLVAALAARYQAEDSVLGRRATLNALSASGASFIAEEPLEPGAALDHLRFTLGEEQTAHTFAPAADVVSCERSAGVGRRDEYLIAVSFTGMTERDCERLNELVIERLTRDELDFNPRIELEKPVAVRYERFDEFVEEVSKDLSTTGMFIRSDSPRPAGSRFVFVLQLGDDFALVQGRAEVVWTRPQSEGAERPRGMGIKFLSLDKTSENVLRQLIQRHVEPSYPRALESPAAPVTAADEFPELLDGEPDGTKPE